MASSASRAPTWSGANERSLLLTLARPLIAGSAFLLVSFGVDRALFAELLRTRLVLELRASRGPGVTGVVSTVLSVLLFGFTGLLAGIPALVSDDAWKWIAISQAVLAFLLAMILLSLLANTLLDPTDIEVLAPHPVPDRTLFAVRLAHLAVEIVLLTACFALPGAFLAGFRKPLLGAWIVYPGLCVLTAATTTGAIVLVFALLLRVFGPGRFQRVSLWVQVAGAMFVVGAFQLLPRALELEGATEFLAAHPGLRRLAPPFQCASLYDLVLGKPASRLAAGLALLTPVLALAITFALASRTFVAGLAGQLTSGASRARAWPTGLRERLAAWTSRSSVERAGYGFAHAMSRREPAFLRAALPQIVSFLCMGCAPLFSRHGGDGMFLVFPIAMPLAMLSLVWPNVLEMAQYTKDAPATWLIRAQPVERYDDLLHGGLRAILLSWMAPALLFAALVETIVLPATAWPVILAGVLLAAAEGLFLVGLCQLAIPFTLSPRGKQTSWSNVALLVPAFVAAGVLVGLLWLAEGHPVRIGVLVVVSAALLVLGYRGLRRMRALNAPAGEPT